jgi:hypothetical protein
MKPLHAIATAALLGTLACSSNDPAPAGSGGSLQASPEGPVSPVDHPPIDPGKGPITSAEPRRLTVDQLRRSFPIALGKDQNGEDITWKVAGNKKGLDQNADTLGEADYIITTEEILEPSPLYLKFADDAARSICDQALASDLTKATPADRTILRRVEKADTVQTNPAGVDDNLRYLALRMHGVKVADDDAATVEPLRTLFTSTVDAFAAGGAPTEDHIKEGWRVVCVALLTAPEFHIY